MKEKTVCFIPIKENSVRSKDKNFKQLAGKKLYQHILDKVSSEKIFSRVFVDTDSKEIKEYALDKKLSVIDRPKFLTAPWVNGNDLLKFAYSEYVKNNEPCDYIFHLHVTAPFIKVETIKKIIDFLMNETYDSVFSSVVKHGWYWHNHAPVNYSYLNPTSESKTEIVKETTGLYGIWVKAFEELGSRLGAKPFAFNLSDIEALDFNVDSDFLYANYLYKLGELEGYL